MLNFKRWQVDLVDTHESEVGGFKEIIFQVNGQDVYSYLKYESGAHRVQRVPCYGVLRQIAHVHSYRGRSSGGGRG